MHLLIPHASALAEPARHVLRDLTLPHLARLLARLVATSRDEGDEYSLSPPHERALAAAWGWQGRDGSWPFAAWAAAGDGIDVQDRAWGLLTPVHWQVGREHVSLTDPDALALTDAESRVFLDAVRGLFESEGYTLAWGASQRWYAAHPAFDGLPTASLDRVLGRNVDLWLPGHPSAGLVRRLQNEVQMLLYTHPLNDQREARGALPVNSFWLSGCGRAQPVDATAVRVDARLRAPLLSQDWAGWADAWRALDAGPLAELDSLVQRGQPGLLTLCGERSAQRWEVAPRTLWQRLSTAWSAPEWAPRLEAL